MVLFFRQSNGQRVPIVELMKIGIANEPFAKHMEKIENMFDLPDLAIPKSSP